MYETIKNEGDLMNNTRKSIEGNVDKMRAIAKSIGNVNDRLRELTADLNAIQLRRHTNEQMQVSKLMDEEDRSTESPSPSGASS